MVNREDLPPLRVELPAAPPQLTPGAARALLQILLADAEKDRIKAGAHE
jgi:hypothetical protein